MKNSLCIYKEQRLEAVVKEGEGRFRSPKKERKHPAKSKHTHTFRKTPR